VWRPLPDWLGGEQPYDLNSWQESETALALADTLDEDAVIVEGYAEYATWRPHLAYLRDPYGDPDMEMEIDGVGGVSILAKAKVFRYGVHFPAFSFEKHAETEGFGKVSSSGFDKYLHHKLTSSLDVEAHGILSGRIAALHYMASVRT
jgi:mannan polymerase II complex ANP1 subunit